MGLYGFTGKGTISMCTYWRGPKRVHQHWSSVFFFQKWNSVQILVLVIDLDAHNLPKSDSITIWTSEDEEKKERKKENKSTRRRESRCAHLPCRPDTWKVCRCKTCTSNLPICSCTLAADHTPKFPIFFQALSPMSEQPSTSMGSDTMNIHVLELFILWRKQ